MRIKCFFFAILAAALAFTLVDAGSLESTFELWRPGEDTTIFTSRLGRLLEGGRMQPIATDEHGKSVYAGTPSEVARKFYEHLTKKQRFGETTITGEDFNTWYNKHNKAQRKRYLAEKEQKREAEETRQILDERRRRRMGGGQ